MTAKIRIEYVRPRRQGEAYGIAGDVIGKMAKDDDEVLVAAEYVTSSGVSALGAVMPAAFELDRGLAGGVFGRITCLQGAMVVAYPEVAPVATDTGGVRLEAGHKPILLPIEGGQRFAAIEAANPPTPQAVGGVSDVIEIVLSLDTAPYVDGDVMADTQVITNAVRTEGGRAVLQSITVLDKDDQGQTFDLVFLNAAQSLGAENGAPNITDANAEAIIALGGASNPLRIAAADYIDLVNCKIATKTGLGVLLEAAAGSRDLYLGTILRGAATYTAAGVRIRLGLLQD